jgi:hypothetical protein
MTLVFILVVAAVLIVMGMRRAVRGFEGEVGDPEQLLGRTQPIDLPAFDNLIDPDEDEYLRSQLSWFGFLRVRNARYRAAAEYVHMAARNAAILIRLAQSAQNSQEAHISEAGKQLMTLAIETRILAGLAIVQLYLALVVPFWKPSLGSVTQAYTGMRATLDRVVRWQRPELAGRIRAVV